MKRILVVMLSALVLCRCADKKEEGHSPTVLTAGEEVVSVYRDGEDVTEE